MSSGACILAHFADQEKLVPAAAKLTADEAITRWDAVDGHVHVVAWTDDAKSARNAMNGLAGVDEIIAYESSSIAKMIAPLDPARSYAYIFLEIEETKRDQVTKALGDIPDVVAFAPARGGCDLIALAAGETFSRVDSVIRDR